MNIYGVTGYYGEILVYLFFEKGENSSAHFSSNEYFLEICVCLQILTVEFVDLFPEKLCLGIRSRPFCERQILDSSKLTVFLDDELKFYENG